MLNGMPKSPDVEAYTRIARSYVHRAKVANWDDATKWFGIYLQVTPHRTPEGVFILPIEYICADLGWPVKKVNRCLATLVASKFIAYDETHRMFLLREVLKVQIPENPNQALGALRRLKELPDSPILLEFLELSRQACFRKGAGSAAQSFFTKLEEAFTERFGQPLGQPLGEGLSKPLTLTLTLPPPLSEALPPTLSPTSASTAGHDADTSDFGVSVRVEKRMRGRNAADASISINQKRVRFDGTSKEFCKRRAAEEEVS